MTTQPNEALVEAVARGLARRNYPSGTPADIDEMWDSFADDARAIIPIVQKAVDGEVVAFLKNLPKSVMHVTEGHTDLVSLIAPGREGAQCELRSFLAHVAEFVERGQHRKA